jgi:hypothetical protein
MPKAPAFDTAAASSGGEAELMPACCIGIVQPTSVVNRVLNICSPFATRVAQHYTLESLSSTVADVGQARQIRVLRPRQPSFLNDKPAGRVTALTNAGKRWLIVIDESHEFRRRYSEKLVDGVFARTERRAFTRLLAFVRENGQSYVGILRRSGTKAICRSSTRLWGRISRTRGNT